MSGVDFIKFKHIFDLFWRKSTLNVLLVAEDHKRCSCQFLLLKQIHEFVFAILKSEFVSRVNDPDQSVSGFKVVAPVRANRCLTTNTPEVELEVIMFNC